MKRIRILEAFAMTKEHGEVLIEQYRRSYGHENLELSIAVPECVSVLEAHESLTSVAMTIPELIRNAVQAEKDGIDGLMVDCMADPGVSAMRENVSIPVLGPGYTSMQVAALLGHKFSLLVTTDFSARFFTQYAHSLGLSSRLASCQVVDIPPEQIGADTGFTLNALVSAATDAIETARADTLVLCCTGFTSLSGELRKRLDTLNLPVPLIDPIPATINVLEALMAVKLSQSKVAYPDTGISRSWDDLRGRDFISAP